MLISPSISVLSGNIQAVYLLGFLKIWSRSQIPFVIDDENLFIFVNSLDLQVQERAIMILSIMNSNKSISPTVNNPWSEKLPWARKHLSETFSGIINMVAPQAQSKVPITIDLESWLIPLKEKDIKLQESPTRQVAESVESLTQPIDLESKMEQLSVSRSSSPSHPDLLSPISSVLHRPPVKKYKLNSQLDGEELLETEKSPNSPPMERKKKKKRSKPHLVAPDIDPLRLVLHPGPIKIIAIFSHEFFAPSTLEYEIPVTIVAETNKKFRITQNGTAITGNIIKCIIKRQNVTNYFAGPFIDVTIAIDGEVVVLVLIKGCYCNY
jgi:hypothetical protein